ncbi:hypothetical protein LGR54_20930 [Ancylobacter sp. Lp-2]|uniref:hypothetical protein n=1 Tax=Ancylobacter sp. Lp-2 TaxID=2881339 RepID=UPI001E3105DB|nr:hypothetical protein [Ancylobacter sp. Lp-2]MCB4771078.1 hypothetical protein [Ancylobacter sp. Lp-2]
MKIGREKGRSQRKKPGSSEPGEFRRRAATFQRGTAEALSATASKQHMTVHEAFGNEVCPHGRHAFCGQQQLSVAKSHLCDNFIMNQMGFASISANLSASSRTAPPSQPMAWAKIRRSGDQKFQR